MKERSLAAFTLLMQTAVGAFWALTALQGWLSRQAGNETAHRTISLLLIVAGALAALGMLASFVHLGAPRNAWRVLANLRSSWLSREILCTLLFAGGGAVYAGLHWLNFGPAILRLAVANVTSLCGAALIICMAQVYRLRTVRTWDSDMNLRSFFTSALLLGCLTVGALLMITPLQSRPLTVALQALALGVVVLLALQLGFVALWISEMASGSDAARQALAAMTTGRRAAFRVRLALAIVGIFLSGVTLSPWGSAIAGRISFLLAFVVILISEIAGRVLFYEAYAREGI